jgi:hypothetical protein
VSKGEVERPCLGAGEALDVKETEALAERPAVLLDRTPQRWIGRVVVDQEDLEVRVVQPREGVEGLNDDLRRFGVGWDVDRHSRRVRARRLDQGLAGAAPVAPAEHLPVLKGAHQTGGQGEHEQLGRSQHQDAGESADRQGDDEPAAPRKGEGQQSDVSHA